MAFVFGLQTLSMKDFAKIFQLKGLKPKNKCQANFYECCDLTKKVYLHTAHFILLFDDAHRVLPIKQKPKIKFLTQNLHNNFYGTSIHIVQNPSALSFW